MSEGEQIQPQAGQSAFAGSAAGSPGSLQTGALAQLEQRVAVEERRYEDPTREWRRLFAELLGTFLLVEAGAGAVVVNAFSHGSIGRGAAVTAPGLAVMAVILFMGAVSGAHLNPVVTLAFAARGDFPWRRVPGYLLVQLLGATFAVLFLDAMFGKLGMLGATVPGAGIDDGQALLMELALTAGLVSTILGTASRSQNVGPLSAVAV